jgi:hypothetical protein
MKSNRKTADIFISEDLRLVLESIKTQSDIAKLLLKKRISKELLVDSFVNYISLSSSDKTKISYLTDERMLKIDKSEYWSSSKRFQVKPGGFISKIFKNIPPTEVEKFSNLFRSETTKTKFSFKIVDGQSIKDYYHYDTYASNESGSLGISCMKHENTQKLLNLYRDNTDKIKLLIMLDSNNLLMGRALLWNLDNVKVMDRIYTINDELLTLHFKKWATENNYYYKSEQNWYNTLKFEQLDKPSKELKLSVNLKVSDYTYYPYMDTFKFIDYKGVLYNYQPNVKFNTLCSCDGYKQESDYLKLDDIDRVYRYRGECVLLTYLNVNTIEKNTYWSSSNDCYILKKDAIYNDIIRDYIFNSEYDSFNNWDIININIEKYQIKENTEKINFNSYLRSIFIDNPHYTVVS